jgi:hypothetical protein
VRLALLPFFQIHITDFYLYRHFAHFGLHWSTQKHKLWLKCHKLCKCLSLIVNAVIFMTCSKSDSYVCPFILQFAMFDIFFTCVLDRCCVCNRHPYLGPDGNAKVSVTPFLKHSLIFHTHFVGITSYSHFLRHLP